MADDVGGEQPLPLGHGGHLGRRTAPDRGRPGAAPSRRGPGGRRRRRGASCQLGREQGPSWRQLPRRPEQQQRLAVHRCRTKERTESLTWVRRSTNPGRSSELAAVTGADYPTFGWLERSSGRAGCLPRRTGALSPAARAGGVFRFRKRRKERDGQSPHARGAVEGTWDRPARGDPRVCAGGCTDLPGQDRTRRCSRRSSRR